jgi:nucleotide-binding universal stress UspA family protein
MMAKRILVPLDGTDESNDVIALVADAARGGGATVRLLQVCPYAENVIDDDGRVIAYADQETMRLENEAMDHLATVAIRFDGAEVERTIRFGDPVTEILLEAEAFGADLIAMTARRRHRLSQFVLGTTAEQVCRRTDVPVMLVRPAPIHA